MRDLKAESAEAVAAGIRAEGGRAIGLACDVTNEESREALAKAAVGAFGKVSILVNNAGGGGPKPLDMPPSTFERAHEINVFSTFRLGQLCVPHREAAGGGAIRTDALASVLTPEIEAAMLKRTPLARLGEALGIAHAELFFCSPAASWVGGQVLTVSGGGVQELDRAAARRFRDGSGPGQNRGDTWLRP